MRRAGGIEVVVRGRTLWVYDLPSCAEEVGERMMEAGWTLMRFSAGSGGVPQGARSGMPMPLPDWDSYGWDKPRVRMPLPDGAAIDRMDQAMDWLMALPMLERKIVFMHYWLGRPFRQIAEVTKVSRMTVHRRATAACGTVLASLKKGGGQMGQKTAA